MWYIKLFRKTCGLRNIGFKFELFHFDLISHENASFDGVEAEIGPIVSIIVYTVTVQL